LYVDENVTNVGLQKTNRKTIEPSSSGDSNYVLRHPRNCQLCAAWLGYFVLRNMAGITVS